MVEDEKIDIIGKTIILTIFIVFICGCFINWKYDGYWKGELCVENYERYADVVKCREDIKNKSPYRVVKYFMNLDRSRNNGSKIL